MNKYPRIRTVHKKPKNTAAKCKCGAVAKFKTEIEYNYMRGDDDFLWSCEDHKKDIKYLSLVNLQKQD